MLAQILTESRHTLTDIAADCGIDWNKAQHQITFDGRKITHGIELNQKYRNKVFMVGRKWTAKDGREYPHIFFYTNKHGEYSESFNGYREHMAARGHTNEWINKQLPPKPPRLEIAPTKEKWQIDAFNNAQKTFDSATSANVSTHDYVVKKGFSFEGCDIRRDGNNLIYPIQNFDGEVIAFQTIDQNGGKKYAGSTGGGFLIIGGSIDDCLAGAYYCEGLATALRIYHEIGAKKMPVVVCLNDAGLVKIVSEFAAYGCNNIKICADYDKGGDGSNAGVYAALKACRSNGIKSFMLPVSTDSNSVDFADTTEFETVKAPKNIADYLAALIEVCPKQSIKKHWKQYAYYLADSVPATRDIETCVNAVNAATLKRGLNVKDDAFFLINRAVTKRRNAIRKLKTITDFEGMARQNVSGKSVDYVAGLMAFEALNQNGALMFDNRGMGGNKTNTMVELAKRLTGGICYISPLVSVCKNAGDRLGFSDYQSTSTMFIETWTKQVNLSICINSIPKFNIAQNFTHLFIDEAAAVYASIFDDTGTNAKQQATLVEHLRAAFKSAKSVLIADAGLGDVEVAFFKSLAGDKTITLIETDTQPTDKKHWYLKNHTAARESILTNLRDGRRGVVACDTVKNALESFKFLTSNGIDPARILLATSDDNANENVIDFLEKPNDYAHLYDVVIHSPIIKSGTSIEFADYSFTYLLYDGIVGTSDAMQMLGRNRMAKDVYLSFGNQIDKTRVTDFGLLLDADIESHRQQGYVLADKQLATLRHEFTASKHFELNDYQNNFLLFAEIAGRDFVPVQRIDDLDTDAAKALAKIVESERLENRFNAKVLTENEYIEISEARRRYQHETDAMKRHETVLMVGNADITIDDVKNEHDGMADVLDAHLFLTTDTSELKKLDKTDFDNGCLKFSRVELQKALIEVLKPLQRGTDNGGINRKDFNKSCDMLEKHAGILALATFGKGNLRLGKFNRINRIRAGATVSNFAEKIGYEIAETGQNGSGNRERIYFLNVNDDIARYATNRKGCS
jgi:hypothetical protein